MAETRRKEFGVWLKAELNRAGVTQLALAKHLKTSPSCISRYLSGELFPRQSRIEEIETFLDTPDYRKWGAPQIVRDALRKNVPSSRSDSVMALIEQLTDDECSKLIEYVRMLIAYREWQETNEEE